MFKHSFTYIQNPCIITNAGIEITRLSSGHFIIYTEDRAEPKFIGKDEEKLDLSLMCIGVSKEHREDVIKAIKVLKEQ